MALDQIAHGIIVICKGIAARSYGAHLVGVIQWGKGFEPLV